MHFNLILTYSTPLEETLKKKDSDDIAEKKLKSKIEKVCMLDISVVLFINLVAIIKN